MIDSQFIKDYVNLYHISINKTKKEALENLEKGEYDDIAPKNFVLPELKFTLQGFHVFNIREHYSSELIKKQKVMNIGEIKEAKKIIENNINSLNDDFKSLITHPINKDFSWGKYGKFNIVMCNNNGYVNGSFLISEAFNYENNLRKKFGKKPLKIANYEVAFWLRYEQTDLFFETIADQVHMKKDDLSFKVSGRQKRGEEMLQGLFLHPLLANSLAMWVSPTYAGKVNEIINSIHISDHKKNIENRLKELEETVTAKDNLIDEIRAKFNESCEKFNMQIIKNEMIITRLNDKLDNSTAQINKNETIITKLNEKLDNSTLELTNATIELKNTTAELKTTSSELKGTSTELRTTKKKLNNTNKKFISTVVALDDTSIQLNRTNSKLIDTSIKLLDTTEKLDITTENLNVVAERFDNALGFIETNKDYICQIVEPESLYIFKKSDLQNNFMHYTVYRI